MAAPGGVFAAKPRAGSRLTVVYDSEGREVEAESREDEEQNVKLGETIELLVAAGYFRARIKGLSPFDKIVGGMTWCITTCNFDVDVDLLFQENSTIGQKIALTEKIVAVLPRMKCPHRIEPHQIQGLDFIHIYPVVQWLVKRAIETKEEMGDYIRAYSVSQFNKCHVTPEDNAFNMNKEKSLMALDMIKDAYRPQRRFRRADGNSVTYEDEELRVHSTLLEYGRRYGVSKEQAKNEKEDERSSKKKAIAAGLAKASDPSQVATTEDLQEEEERRVKALMSTMTSTDTGRLTASAVGSMVGMQSEEIKKIASEYADKQAELEQQEQSAAASGGGGLQQHKRTVASLQKQIQQQRDRVVPVKQTHDVLSTELQQMQINFKDVADRLASAEMETKELEEAESGNNKQVLEKLRGLITQNEALKKTEAEFRTKCKDELSRLQSEIERLKAEFGASEQGDEERYALIEERYTADKEKLQSIRLRLAKRNREIASLQRKIDEVPTQAELSQYQRRFVELYNQVAATHKETKQFYTLYNTLDDTKLYLNKEVELLNSIHDNFERGMSSATTKEQFIKQLDQIVESVKGNRLKVERKKQQEKARRDQLNDQYLDLMEKQRQYFKTVKDFRDECSKNELLLTHLREAGR